LYTTITQQKINSFFCKVIIAVCNLKQNLNIIINKKKLIKITYLFKKKVLNNKLGLRFNANYAITINTLTQKILLIILNSNN